jgi:hypothetical protein
MENQLAWHYKSPDSDQLVSALAELGAMHETRPGDALGDVAAQTYFRT